ncbi:MAG TPA: peptide deformylase [Bryobacteraceae bacterium]|nr:peptide deformylase [Bryobacteraceae bacterium]
MPARRILQLGDPLLRAVSSPVSDPLGVNLVFHDLRDTLAEFRRSHGFGRGISAVQIGELKRLIYIEFAGTAYRIVNPTVEFCSETKITLWDDCFSFPNLMVRLERAECVRVAYTGEDGGGVSLEASGALAELLQHEMDHLDGILAVDRALDRDSLATRDEWERRFRHATHSGMGASIE